MRSVYAGPLAVAIFGMSSAFAGEISVGGGYATPPSHLPAATGQVVFPKAVQSASEGGEVQVGQTVSASDTEAVSTALRSAVQFCANLPQSEYVIDCYAAELEQLANAMPASGDYAQARAAIAKASNELSALVRQNASPTLPRIRAKRGGGSTKPASRPLTPVATERLPEVSQQAAAIVAEAQTVLLRSTSNSDARRSHYQRVAQSMETGTILLRSL